MVDQRDRFERWRRRLPENTGYLVTLVLDEIVPVFRAHGLERFSDYAGGSRFGVGANCLPLQRRWGPEWPTVEIQFHKSGYPSLGVHFATLPETCWRHTLQGTTIEIPRIQACVVEGLAFFVLCKGTRKNFDGNFGYRGFVLNPKHRLREEIGVLKSLLPWLFNVLQSLPEAWLDSPPGYVASHAFLSPASNIFRKGLT
jgi:hypothetical protein